MALHPSDEGYSGAIPERLRSQRSERFHSVNAFDARTTQRLAPLEMRIGVAPTLGGSARRRSDFCKVARSTNPLPTKWPNAVRFPRRRPDRRVPYRSYTGAANISSVSLAPGVDPTSTLKRRR